MLPMILRLKLTNHRKEREMPQDQNAPKTVEELKARKAELEQEGFKLYSVREQAQAAIADVQKKLQDLYTVMGKIDKEIENVERDKD